MASYNFYSLFCIWLLFILLNNTVQASRLHNMEKSIHESSQNGYISYSDEVKASSYKTLHSPNVEHRTGELLPTLETEGFVRDALFSSVQPLDNGLNIINHYAALKIGEGAFYGAMATLNVWALPTVGINQSSSSVLCVGIQDGPRNDHNIMCAGWQVFPKLYGGDHDTHLMVYWTADGGLTTGCYNLQCKGFIPYESSKYVPGSNIRPLSTFNGAQYEMTFTITRDNVTGDWWLHVGRDADKPVGHWPKFLFPKLSDSLSMAEWGGFVTFPSNEKSPPMGSGQFPAGGERNAAYLKNPLVANFYGQFDYGNPHRAEDKTDCYQIDGRLAYGFYFGGPGGCTD